MRRERRVLEDRIEALAIERRRVEAQERVRGQQHEGEEADPDQGLHREHPCLEGGRQVAPEQRDAAAVEREDPDPQHERALVVAPRGGDLVDQRLGGVRVGRDVGDREVGRREGMDQRAEGDGEKHELAERARAGERDQAGVAARRAQKRQGTLDQRQAERQHQGVVADLGDHCSHLLFRGLAVAPDARLLQRVGDLGRHIVLVVLGEDLAGREHAVLAEHALCDDPLPLTEQIRQNALVADRHLVRPIGQAELHHAVAGTPLDAAVDHQATEAKALVGIDLAGRDVARRDEERDAVAKRGQHETARATQQQKRDDHQNQALSLAQTHGLIRSPGGRALPGRDDPPQSSAPGAASPCSPAPDARSGVPARAPRRGAGCCASSAPRARSARPRQSRMPTRRTPRIRPWPGSQSTMLQVPVP